MATWRILAQSGNDANAGTAASPWRTLGMIASKIADGTIKSGDVVEIGERFRSQSITVSNFTGLTIRQAPGHPMAHLDYGQAVTVPFVLASGAMYDATLPEGTILAGNCAVTWNYDGSLDSEGHTRAFLRRNDAWTSDIAATPNTTLPEEATYSLNPTTRVLRVWAPGGADLTDPAEAAKIEIIVQPSAPVLFDNCIDCVFDMSGAGGTGTIFGRSRITISRAVNYETGLNRRYAIRRAGCRRVHVLGYGVIQDAPAAHVLGINVTGFDCITEIQLYGKNGQTLGDPELRSIAVVAGQPASVAGEVGNTGRNYFRGVVSMAPLMRPDGSSANVEFAYAASLSRTHGDGAGPGPDSLVWERFEFKHHSLHPMALGLINAIRDGASNGVHNPCAPSWTDEPEAYAQRFRDGSVVCSGSVSIARGRAAFERVSIDTDHGASGVQFSTGSTTAINPGVLLRGCVRRMRTTGTALGDSSRHVYLFADASGLQEAMWVEENCLTIHDAPNIGSSGTVAERSRQGMQFQGCAITARPLRLRCSRNIYIKRAHGASQSGSNSWAFLRENAASWATANDSSGVLSVDIDRNLWIASGDAAANWTLCFGGDRFLQTNAGAAVHSNTVFAPGNLGANEYTEAVNYSVSWPVTPPREPIGTDVFGLIDGDGDPIGVFDRTVPMSQWRLAQDSPLWGLAASLGLSVPSNRAGELGLNERLYDGAFGPWGLGLAPWQPMRSFEGDPALPASVVVAVVADGLDQPEILVRTAGQPEPDPAMAGIRVDPATPYPFRVSAPSPGGSGRIAAAYRRGAPAAAFTAHPTH